MRKYKKYKSSGIDWIGEIPSHWEIFKPKFKLNRVTRTIDENDEVVTCFRDGTVTLRKNRREDGFTNSIKEHGYQQIKPGDLVVHEMDGFAGAIGISDSKGKSTPVYTVIEPDSKNDLKYFSFLLREMSNTGKIESLSKGIRERTTDFRWKTWSNIYFPFPPLSEQKLISNYLNDKTKKIDDLIEKIQLKINYINEQKESLINNQILKGFNKSNELKDSAIDWIGKIPKHWKINRLKRVSLIKNGFAFPSSELSINSDVPVIRISDVKSPMDLTTCLMVPAKYLDKHKDFIVKKNDILVGLTGGTIGKSSEYNLKELALLNQRVCVLRSVKDVSQSYLSLFIQSNLFKHQIKINSKGDDQPNIGRDELMNFYIILPPREEQDLIDKNLVNQIRELNSLIDKEKKVILFLKEYSCSLISNFVTGKFSII